MAVGSLGHVQAEPVDDRVFFQLIHETDAHLLTATKADDRSEVRTGKNLKRIRRALQ
jgi:hypothetical protein